MDELDQKIKHSIIESTGNLLEEHWRQIKEFIDESQTGKGSVALGVTIDYSEANPKVVVKLSYSKKVSDERIDMNDDPNQGSLNFGEGADPARLEDGPAANDDAPAPADNVVAIGPEPTYKKKRGRKKAAANVEPEAEPSEESATGEEA
jgi:hypothetical protein